MQAAIATTAATSLVVLSMITSSANASPRPGIGAPTADSLERAASSSGVREEAPKNGVYIVRMAGMPVVAYEGGVKGLEATKPTDGEKIEPKSTAATRYANHLRSRQDQAVAEVGGSALYNYVYAFNGFAAKLTPTQIVELRANKDVVSVTPDAVRQLDTSTTPEFLGLSQAGTGVWDTQGRGEGVVIGIIDTGITPDAASFSDPAPKPDAYDFTYPTDWFGSCQPGESFTLSDCSDKIVGARFYNSGWGGNAGIDTNFPWDYNSPLDYDGHGTHTASTAGGNSSVDATGLPTIFGSPVTISGIAPHAHVSAYKVCWGGDAGGCQDSDSVAAIDQAVADGVDVINFSISGSQTNFLDPVEVAFMYAADAGVFVSASAGNSGPTASTVAHPGPWVTTVAAGTHNRAAAATVTLGNTDSYTGPSLAESAVPSAPLILASEAGKAGANATQLRLCYGTADGATPLDPTKVTGKIVVCDRGVTARVNKSAAVKAAGGVGMILVNTSPNSLNADLHEVPTVHLDEVDGAAIKTYAAGGAGTASISAAAVDYNVPAPETAYFSSRGPIRAGAGDLLKPDLIAPGQDILAAVAPPGNSGRSFDFLSGTSMSSPHTAGLAALIRGVKTGWSPMAVKSALMTTGYDVLDTSVSDADRIFRQGAGHVKPSSAFDPGLVFDSDWDDWLEFLCATQLDCTGTAIPVVDPSDLNTPSISIGALAGSQTVTRRVTNVSGSALTYDNAAVTGLTGFDVSFSPVAFTLPAGSSTDIAITITRTSAPVNTYEGGQITWTGAGVPTVRIPVVVKPVTLAAPPEVNGSYDVQFGYPGAFTATARGLVPAVLTNGTVADDPTDGPCELSAPNAATLPITVPADTTFARFGILDEDVSPAADLDLCVFDDTDALVGQSLSAGSTETVDLVDPPAGAYRVVVQGYDVDAGTPSPFILHSWLLGATNLGNMTVTAPASATLGATGAIGLTFAGLLPETKYLGSVVYSGVADLPDPTIVRVDTPEEPGPTPTVTVTATPEPAATVTVTPTPEPAATVTVTPTPTATIAPVSCAVKAVSGASKLKVNMGPNLPGRGYYVFRVDKRVSGQWIRVLKEVRTRGAGETRTVNVPKGTFRVKCYGQGFPTVTGSLAGDTTSKTVKIKR